jgi:hypothetical protein
MFMGAHDEPPAPIQIHSARDWLSLPSTSGPTLSILQFSSKLSNTKSFPPRIIKAWMCEEEKGEDIVYVEVVMPPEYGMLPGIHIDKEEFSVGEKYNLQRLLVSRKEYKQLQERQKELWGMS